MSRQAKVLCRYTHESGIFGLKNGHVSQKGICCIPQHAQTESSLPRYGTFGYCDTGVQNVVLSFFDPEKGYLDLGKIGIVPGDDFCVLGMSISIV